MDQWSQLVDDGQNQLVRLAEEQRTAMRLLVEEVCCRLKEVQPSKDQTLGECRVEIGTRMPVCPTSKPVLLMESTDSSPPSPGSSRLNFIQSLGSYPGPPPEGDDCSETSSVTDIFEAPQLQQPHNTANSQLNNSAGEVVGSPNTLPPSIRGLISGLKDGRSGDRFIMDHFLSEKDEFGGVSRHTRLKYFLDYVAGGLVLLNSLVMLFEFQLEGNANGEMIGYHAGSAAAWNDAVHIFRALDVTFVIVFTIEWIVRIFLDRMEFLTDFANWFDTLCVISGVIDLILRLSLEDTNEASRSVVILRLMRALKSLRAIRMVRSLRFFRGLRVLVRACQCFLPSLCWSMVLLGVFMTMGALMMGNLLQAFILDEALPETERYFLWERYGTAYRATYTLFEITFAGNWPVNVRPVLENASQAFVVFFVLYITVVVFAVIRVISAVFLKDTFDAAQNDAEQLVVDKLRLKSQYIAKLERIFRAIDVQGDGVVTEERLMQILANPKVAAYFQTLDLDVHEGRALFHLLDNGDGEVTLDEFIDGIMRCKGHARAIDQVAMHADLKQLSRRIAKLHKEIRKSPVKTSTSSGNHRKQAENLKIFRIDASMTQIGRAHV